MVFVPPDAPTAVQMDLYKDVKGGANSATASDYAQAKATGEKTWRLLKQKNHHYDQRAEDTKKRDLLYEGGFQMNKPEIAKLFCPQMKNEEDQSVYKERVGSAAYVPTFSKLITGLVSNLYSQDLAVMEAADHNDSSTAGEELTDDLRDFYKLLQGDCDGFGTTLHNFMRCSTTKALIHSFNYFGVDYPKGDADNLLEQEQLGLDKPRLYHIDSECVYDWRHKKDSNIEFEWIKLVYCNKVQPTPFDPPMNQYVVKTWFMNEQGLAAYECYESDPLPVGKEPKDKDILKKSDEGTTSFKCLPIFYWCLDDGIAVGQKLAPMAAEYFNRTTIENHSTNRACLTIPVIYRGEMLPGDGSLPNPSAFNLERGLHPRGKVNSKGVVELGAYTQDRLEIVEADGKALAFIHKQNEDIDEKMHSVVHQMGQSLKQARTQSGKTAASKQEDRHATEMLLTAIADEVYNVTQRVFQVISESRGENIVWDVRGLSAISMEDREELTKEAAALDSIPIPSITFKKEYHYRLASRLVEGTDQRTLHTIRSEIEEGLDTQATQATQATQDQTMQSATPMPSGQATDPKINSLGGSDEWQMTNTNTSSTKLDHSNLPTVDSEMMALGPSNQSLLPDGSHLQTGEHISGQTVFEQLAQDYEEKDIEWVKHISWIGPVEVPLGSIDFSNKDKWQASQDVTHVDEFVQKIKEGFSKPIILVNNPSNDNKMQIVDGHHRSLAYLQLGQPAVAYIGMVGSDKGPWSRLHDQQVGKKGQGSGAMQASMQSTQVSQQVEMSIQTNQTSIQKDAQKQVKASERAIGGKTK